MGWGRALAKDSIAYHCSLHRSRIAQNPIRSGCHRFHGSGTINRLTGTCCGFQRGNRLALNGGNSSQQLFSGRTLLAEELRQPSGGLGHHRHDRT
jgi:hypothetical protein